MTALTDRRVWAVQHGYLDAPAHEVLRTVVGSGLHGMAIPRTDDTDEMGVYVEPAEVVLGVRGAPETYTARTQPEGARSGPGDVDLTIHALRKYLRLACVGNPTILLPLYAPADAVLHLTPTGEALRALAPAFASAQAGRRFLGYLDAQRERLVGGGKRNRVPKRPELVDAHGYDTKYASHAIRLGMQGRELLTTGRLTLPLTDAALDFAMEVKRGDVDYPEAVARVGHVRALLVAALDDPQVPPEPDYRAVEAFSVAAHLQGWAW